MRLTTILNEISYNSGQFHTFYHDFGKRYVETTLMHNFDKLYKKSQRLRQISYKHLLDHYTIDSLLDLLIGHDKHPHKSEGKHVVIDGKKLPINHVMEALLREYPGFVDDHISIYEVLLEYYDQVYHVHDGMEPMDFLMNVLHYTRDAAANTIDKLHRD